jgi:hypothetical protein
MNGQIKMLSNLSTLEVSTVKHAANRKRFAITKSETETMSDVIKAVLGVKAEGEDQFVATLKSAGADDKRIEAATAMYRMRKGFADVLKPEDLGVTTKAHEEPDGDEQMEGETDEEYKARKTKKKSCKSADQSDAPGLVADPRVEALFKSNQVLSEQVKQLVAKNQEMEYVAKAEREFSHVPGSAIDIARTLQAAHAAGPDTAKQIESALKSVNEIVSKSAHLQEFGSTGGGMAGGAYQKIQALANGLTMKSDKGREMTAEQKFNHVVTNTAEGRALYTQYLEEHRQAVKAL